MLRNSWWKPPNRLEKRYEAESRGRIRRLTLELLEDRVVLTNALVIPAGFDLLQTTAGAGTFRNVSLPADFFAPGSDPFVGVISLAPQSINFSPGSVVFQGQPVDFSGTESAFLATTFSQAPTTGLHQQLFDARLGPNPFAPTDTVVRRLLPVELPNPGDTRMVPIEFVGLSLVSVMPITVTYNGGQNPETWNVSVALDPNTPPAVGNMSVTRSVASPTISGTFSSTIPIRPQFTFSRVGPPAQVQMVFNDTYAYTGNFTMGYAFPDTRTQIQLQTPSGLETIDLFGPKSVIVNLPPDGAAGDNGGNPGLDDVSTNMYQLDMSGFSPTLGPVHVYLNRNILGGQAFGRIEEVANGVPGRLEFPADSFFDVFVEVELPMLGLRLHNLNGQPVRMQTTLNQVPPAVDDMYFSTTPPRQLFDPGNNPVPVFLVGATCTPRPVLDFGDAPDRPYPTLLANDGARHLIVPGAPRLGTFEDSEPDGQPHPSALGDDLSGSPDDEDGIAFTSPLIAGGLASVTVTVSGAPGKLDAWVDFNQDGDWLDAGEQIFTSLAVTPGANLLTFAVPASYAPTKLTFSRWRISTAGGLKPTGFARDGEVEDSCIGSFLHGQKWNDQNANGVRDAGEVGLDNITIDLYDASGVNLLTSTTTMSMDFNHDTFIDPQTERGIYWFQNLTPGTYRIRERPADMIQTYPLVLGSSEYLVTVGNGQSIGIAPAEAVTQAGPGAHWVDHAGTPFVDSFFDVFFSVAEVQVQSLNPTIGLFTQNVFLSGQTQIHRGQPRASNPGAPCQLDTIDTEMVALDLRGTSPMLGNLRLRAGRASGVSTNTTGLIQEQVGDPSLADSFFDVFFEIDTPLGTLHNQQPLRVFAVIDRIPPFGVPFVFSGGPIMLFDAGNQPTGVFINQVRHTPKYGLDFGNTKLDFGDAPDAVGGPAIGNPYPTLLIHHGARHVIVPGFNLGPEIDHEGDGQPNATATGDDLAGAIPDDEDGVVFTSSLTVGGVTGVTVSASAPGLLDAWIDFNDDGDWADPGEQIFDNFPLAAGLNALSFGVPGSAVVTPQTFSRFRFSSAGVVSFTGFAPNGEVEDYQVAIQSSGILVGSAQVGVGAMADTQRSMVTAVKVTFNRVIAPAELTAILSRFAISRMGGLVGTLLLTGTLDVTGTMVTLRFEGTSVIGGSLADGRYSLTFDGATVMDGTRLFRLFGDITGNGQVDSADQTEFDKAMNTRKGLSVKYSAFFDYTGDGVIINSDSTEFGKRKGKKLDASGFVVPL